MIDRRVVLDKGFVELIHVYGTDDDIDFVARVEEPEAEVRSHEKVRRIIRTMMRERHTSPFEHVITRWRIKCPLFIARQWHRHRTWSYNEESARYKEVGPEFHIPSSLRLQDKTNRQHTYGQVKEDLEVLLIYELTQKYEAAYDLYVRMLKEGVGREQARMVLPQATYTTFYGTVDFHNLMHFLSLRADRHAQFEIQQYANSMLHMLNRYEPLEEAMNAWYDYRFDSGGYLAEIYWDILEFLEYTDGTEVAYEKISQLLQEISLKITSEEALLEGKNRRAKSRTN